MPKIRPSVICDRKLVLGHYSGGPQLVPFAQENRKALRGTRRAAVTGSVRLVAAPICAIWRRLRARASAAKSIFQNVKRAVSCMVRAVACVSWPKFPLPSVLTKPNKLV